MSVKNPRKVVCDEMIDPVTDEKLRSQGLEVYRPEPSESDEEVLELAGEHRAPVITRDRDFVEKHRDNGNHHGIIFDPGMHHRTTDEVVNALNQIFQLMDAEELENTIIRLKRFY